MKLTLHRSAEPFRFDLQNSQGFTLQTDASQQAGGGEQGFRPMELLLAGLVSCTSIDVILILQKQKLDIQDYRVEVSGSRAEATPAVFTEIHLHFTLQGKLDPKKVERAISLSLEKYCSAAAMLSQTASITTDFEIIP
ncbi:MAG: OsmC family protein [Bacteroidota bacterium]